MSTQAVEDIRSALVRGSAGGSGGSAESGQSAGAGGADAASASAATQPVPLGEALTVATGNGGRVRVTPQAVHDPARAARDRDGPDDGARFVAVELTLANRGDARHEDAPTNGGVLVDDHDVAYSARIIQVEGCERLPPVTVAPGNQRSGCLVFEVPTARTPRLFQFATDTGLGPTVAEWGLRPGTPEASGPG